jgi:hypothetical protein
LVIKKKVNFPTLSILAISIANIIPTISAEAEAVDFEILQDTKLAFDVNTRIATVASKHVK